MPRPVRILNSIISESISIRTSYVHHMYAELGVAFGLMTFGFGIFFARMPRPYDAELGVAFPVPECRASTEAETFGDRQYGNQTLESRTSRHPNPLFPPPIPVTIEY